jgi:hypothetical protein
MTTTLRHARTLLATQLCRKIRPGAPQSTLSVSSGLLDRGVRIPPAVEPNVLTDALDLFATVLKGGGSVVHFRSGVRSTTIPPTTLSFNIAASIGGTVRANADQFRVRSSHEECGNCSSHWWKAVVTREQHCQCRRGCPAVHSASSPPYRLCLD